MSEWNTGKIKIAIQVIDTLPDKDLLQLHNYLNEGRILDISRNYSTGIATYTIAHPDFCCEDGTEYDIRMKVNYDNNQRISYIGALTTFKNNETVIVKQYDTN